MTARTSTEQRCWQKWLHTLLFFPSLTFSLLLLQLTWLQCLCFQTQLTLQSYLYYNLNHYRPNTQIYLSICVWVCLLAFPFLRYYIIITIGISISHPLHVLFFFSTRRLLSLKEVEFFTKIQLPIFLSLLPCRSVYNT